MSGVSGASSTASRVRAGIVMYCDPSEAMPDGRPLSCIVLLLECSGIDSMRWV